MDSGKEKKWLEDRIIRSRVLEGLVILVGSVAVYAYSSSKDVLEGIVNFAGKHESWELDELIPVAIFLVCAISIFSIRRWNEVRAVKNELLRKNKDLQKALDEIKRLRGILPICMECKKIRDDAGYWHPVELYIRDHSEAEFTHGICPDCMRKLYPDMAEDAEAAGADPPVPGGSTEPAL